MKTFRTAVLLLVILVILMPVAVFASDVSGATWKGTTRVTNSGNSTAENAIATANISSQALIDNGYASANLSDVAVQYGSTDVPFMPSTNATNPWVFFVDSISAGLNINYSLYSGGASGGFIRYFPGPDGMSANHSANLTLSDNFTIEQKGWVDTTSVNSTLANKEGAFRTYISAAGNITSALRAEIETSNWESPTGATGWTDPAKVMDELTDTHAYTTVTNGTWSSNFTVTRNEIFTDRVRVWVSVEAGGNVWAVSVHYTGGWHEIYNGDITPGSWQTLTIGSFESVGQANISRYSGGSVPYEARIHEFDFNEAGEVSVTAPDISSGNHTVKTQYQPNLVTDATFVSGDPPTAPWSTFHCVADRIDDIFGIDYYSVNLTSNGDFANLSQTNTTTIYNGKTLILGMWVFCPSTNDRIQKIYLRSDGDGAWDRSAELPKDDAAHWVTVTSTIGTTSTYVRVGIEVNQTEVSDTDDVIVIGGPILIEGNSIANFNTLRIFIDDVEKDQTYTEVAVPDNSSNWTYYENMGGYWEYTKIWCGDTLQQHIEWEYDAYEFTDLSGKGHHATPTFRTASSDNISTSLISFGPVSESELDTFTLASSYDVLIADATPEGRMFEDGDYSKLPAEPINAMLDEAGIPRAAWWLPFLFLGICVIGFIVYGATTMTRGPSGNLHEGQFDGSLLLMFIVMEVLLVVLGTMGPIPLWPSYLFPLAGLSLILSRKHFAWG